jgi:hypothetical protein
MSDELVRFYCVLIVGALSIVSAGAHAQVREGDSPPLGQRDVAVATRGASHSTNRADSTHSYDALALRFVTSWGNVRIIRGAQGAVIGTAGWFRDPGLEALLAASPRAVTEVKDYETNNFRGSLVGGIGAAATVVGILVAANGSNNASTPIIVVGGVSAMAWGAQHLSMSYAALSRAMWWYNRDVAR